MPLELLTKPISFTSDNGPAEIVNDWEIFNSNGIYRGMKRDPYEGELEFLSS